MIIIEAILCYFVWVHGWGALALLPLGVGVILAIFTGFGITAAGGNPQEMVKKRDPQMMVFVFIIDIIIVAIMVVMLLAPVPLGL